LNADLGKSIFLYYVLLRRLSDRPPTAFQLSNSFVLFQASGAQSYPNDEYDLFIPPGTLALADVRENVSIPCNAFLHASWEGNARIVQAAPPYQDSWKEWRKQHGANLYVMNYFSADEIKVLGFVELDIYKRFFLAELFRIEPYFISKLTTSYAFTILGVPMRATACGSHRTPRLKAITDRKLVLPWKHLSGISLLV